jgi:averantin hydroxylase
MREQQPIIQSYVDSLIANLRTKVDQGPQDMVAWFNFTTFDVIGRLAFGESFGCLDRGDSHPWIEAIFNNLKALVFIRTFQRLGFRRLLPLIAGTKAQKLRMYNHEFSSDRIESRVKRGAEQGDFWDNVLKHSDLERDPNVVPEKGMHIEEMKANASNLVLAGSETTATLLSGCVYQLLKNPEWMRKVTQEIRSSFKSKDDIDMFSVNKLEYTLAALEETMRIYPPVPTQALRLVPEGGDTIDGKYLPGGTLIQMPQYVAYHLPSNFAKPEEFHPERWLDVSAHPEAKEFEGDNKAVMQPFSVGPRNCIGRNLAYAEMRLILSKVLYSFDLELDEERTGDWTGVQKTFILWEKGPLWVNIKEAGKGRG